MRTYGSRWFDLRFEGFFVSSIPALDGVRAFVDGVAGGFFGLSSLVDAAVFARNSTCVVFRNSRALMSFIIGDMCIHVRSHGFVRSRRKISFAIFESFCCNRRTATNEHVYLVVLLAAEKSLHANLCIDDDSAGFDRADCLLGVKQV